jgi:hypothetical protein
VYVTGLTSATNFELALTNMNTASSTTVCQSVSLIIDTSSFEALASTVRVNGTIRALRWPGGVLPDITGATQVLQQISVMYSGSSGIPISVFSTATPLAVIA